MSRKKKSFHVCFFTLFLRREPPQDVVGHWIMGTSSISQFTALPLLFGPGFLTGGGGFAGSRRLRR